MSLAKAYYNERDRYAAQWLRNLIANGLIPDGDVDERDIQDVRPSDLSEYTQCHFFAGLGGWCRALALAGWPDDRPVWTGSCPCQPFSAAGLRQGAADERHLWACWFGLIRECRPATVFGEQVAGAVGKGWLDAVAHDLEGEGYAFGAAVLPACAVGAPHRRDRLWFVADAIGCQLWNQSRRRDGQSRADTSIAGTHGEAWHVAHSDGGSLGTGGMEAGSDLVEAIAGGERFGSSCNGLGSITNRQGEHAGTVDAEMACASESVAVAAFEPREAGWISGSSWWTIEPDVGRVAHGIPGRVGKQRALGNAIVPQVAAEFIVAYMEVQACA